MISINNTFTTLQQSNVQKEQKQNFPKLQTLKQDTVSFSGLFSKKPPGPKHVTKEAYEVITGYIEKNANDVSARKAVQFMKFIKRICEEGLLLNLRENAEFTAELVEKQRIGEISNILMTVKTNVLPSSSYEGTIKNLMDRCKNILGKSAN